MTSFQRRPGHSFKSKANLVSKVNSQVHLIEWQDLLRITRVYPEIGERIMEQMELSYDLDSTEMVRKQKIEKSIALDKTRTTKPLLTLRRVLHVTKIFCKLTTFS